jgi:glycosyltransferase involved in cell wall biosynthesis
MSPLVSVIMPVYNAEQYLEEAVRSILEQTFSRLELIAVDDGSADRSPEILRRLAEEDSRLRCIEGAHGGACRARNLAIEAAGGEWIVAMDADDVSVPHRIETLLAAAKAQPEVVLWGSYLRRVGPKGEVIGNLELGPTSVAEFRKIDLCESIIPIFNPTAMYPTTLVRKVGGYDESLPAAQESELWDRLVDHGPAVTVPEPLLLYRLHENTISFRKQRIQKYLHGFPPARRRAAREGRILALDEYLGGFDASEEKKGFIGRHREDFARRHVKIALIRKSDRRWLAAAWHAGLACLAHPKFIIDRIKTLKK